MKKKISVFACVVALLLTFTVVAFAEGETTGDGGEAMWNLWGLLSSSNVDYLGIIGTLITTIVTFFKIIGGGSSVGGNIMNAIKTFLEFLK